MRSRLTSKQSYVKLHNTRKKKCRVQDFKFMCILKAFKDYLKLQTNGDTMEMGVEPKAIW